MQRQAISTPSNAWASTTLAVGRDGDRVHKSTNGGASCDEVQAITGIRLPDPTMPNASDADESFPSMAVDVSGGENGWIRRVDEHRIPGEHGRRGHLHGPLDKRRDLGDAGREHRRDVRSQYEPWMSCDPVTTLSVVFYDRRDDAGDLLTTAYVAHSLDGGTT